MFHRGNPSCRHVNLHGTLVTLTSPACVNLMQASSCCVVCLASWVAGTMWHCCTGLFTLYPGNARPPPTNLGCFLWPFPHSTAWALVLPLGPSPFPQRSPCTMMSAQFLKAQNTQGFCRNLLQVSCVLELNVIKNGFFVEALTGHSLYMGEDIEIQTGVKQLV